MIGTELGLIKKSPDENDVESKMGFNRSCASTIWLQDNDKPHHTSSRLKSVLSFFKELDHFVKTSVLLHISSILIE
jgi:hypothetical protein